MTLKLKPQIGGSLATKHTEDNSLKRAHTFCVTHHMSSNNVYQSYREMLPWAAGRISWAKHCTLPSFDFFSEPRTSSRLRVIVRGDRAFTVPLKYHHTVMLMLQHESSMVEVELVYLTRYSSI